MPNPIQAAAEGMPSASHRRPLDIETIMSQPDLERYAVGDIIIFQKADGFIWPILLLGITENDEFEASFWNGRPNLFYILRGGLDALRIVKVERMSAKDVAAHRAMLGLDGRIAA